MTSQSSKSVLILATDGFEQSELERPRDDLRAAGVAVRIASLKPGSIKGWDQDDWGRAVDVDTTIGEVDVAAYDALVLPGGQINPDTLRAEPDAVALIRRFADAGKPVAAICHAPWLLIEAGFAKGRTMTGFKSIRTDLANAGATVVDQAVATDGPFITSRDPDDLDAFGKAILKAIGA